MNVPLSLRRHFVHSGGAIVGVQLLMLWLGARVGSALAWRWIMPALALLSLWAWLGAHRRYRLVGDVPASRIGSAAQGYVELQGVALKSAESPTVSPITGLPCVWYHFRVEEKTLDGRAWQVEREGISDDTFEISDDTGRCVIDPDGAEVITTHKAVWEKDGQRYTEWLLLPQGRIYVLGMLTTLHGAGELSSFDADVGDVLAEWKKDRRQLLRRFDRNGDGEIDLGEWEAARAEAKKEVQAQQRELRAQEGVNVVRKPADGRAFLLSSKSPDALAKTYRWWSWLHLAAFFAAVGTAARLLG